MIINAANWKNVGAITGGPNRRFLVPGWPRHKFYALNAVRK